MSLLLVFQLLFHRSSQIKTNMLTNQISQQQNKKCTRLLDCSCLMCCKENEIMEKLNIREGLEWFGKRRSLSQKNHSLREGKLELLKLTNIKQEKKNKKNESETFDRVKRHLDCNSSYLTNYNKKQLQDTSICHPIDNISPPNQSVNTFKTIYNDSFYLKNLKVEKEKSMKRLQMVMELPFVGKSSYKKEFSTIALTERTMIHRPRDNIKMGCDNRRIYGYGISKSQTKVPQLFIRPPSPIKNKGHIMKSNSYAFAYNTLYKNTFQKETGIDVLISEPNPEFLKRSKFGSLSKTRWTIKQKVENQTKESPLQMYM